MAGPMRFHRAHVGVWACVGMCGPMDVFDSNGSG